VLNDQSDGSAQDAGFDVQPQHCSAGVFAAPIPITELNTSAEERGLRLTSDERTAVFSRGTQTSLSHIFVATRASVTASFNAAVVITGMDPYGTFQTLYPTLANDGRTLFVESACQADVGEPVNSPVCRLDSDAGMDAWMHTYWLPVLIDNIIYNGTFGAGFSEGDGYATQDGLGYYAVAAVSVDGGAGLGIYESQLQPPGPVVQRDGKRVLVFFDGVSTIDNPVLSRDELVLFLSFTTAAQSTPHIGFATRSSTDVAFGPLTPLPELDSAEGEYPSWISSDLCRIYLTRRVNGQSDLFMASRSN
jgi:hypothetical protein